MASQNNTMVIIDPDGTGPLLAVTNTLNQGESWFYPGGVRRGASINSSKPVEADLVCGDTVSTYAIDWFTLYPQSDWSGTYYTPVPTTVHSFTTFSTYMYFFNNSTAPITIFYTNLVATNNFILPANGGYKFLMPQSSGAVFASAGGEKYTTLSTVAGAPADDTSYNWGFTPLPKGSLTTEAVAGWAPGTSDYTGNGSPVWVTPTANTRIYVDYHGDHAGPLTDPNGNKYDTNFDLTVFQSKTIYVPGTNDQTGLRIYTTDGTLLSAVWGEDPAVANASNPYLDLGNPVLPFPVPKLTKSAMIITDAPPAGLSIGDTLLYTVQVDNKGLLPLGNTVVVDAPPATLSYISNSTSYNGSSIPDSASGTAFPLDTPGYTIPIILSGGTSVFQYKAVIVGAGSIVNAAGVPGYNITVTNTVPAIAPAPSFFVSKSILSPASGVAGVGQAMQFNLQIINNGNVPLPNVSVTDNYPSNLFSFVSANITPNTAGNGQITWTNLGTLAIGADTNLIISLLVTNTSALATNFAIAASPGNTTNTGTVAFTNIAAPVAAVTVNKTITAPAGSQAGIGQTVSFNLQVFNSGYLALTNLALTDSFPRTNFSFISASVTPNVVTTNSLTWTNLGTFAVGQITNIAVNFIVTNYSASVTNFAIATSVGGATNTNSAVLQISRSGLSVNKTVLSPTNQPVPLGSNLVFRIVIRNTGQLAITNLPFEDTYSASYLQYVSAAIAPNSIAPGDLFWTNLAGASGMATNVAITNDVTMKVVGGATPANNLAAANFAVDVNNAAVAPASSVVGVNTAAGQISGKVYADPDQSGSLTAGDAPLENVTLSLYTDPNADGNPADGTLLQMIGSDANGYYELLNLSTGAYVVVETILPGYTGTAPANNRLAVTISSLTAATNQNFFQYQIPAANYATVNGTVWNDVNGVGFFQAGDTGLTNVQVDLIQDLNTNGIVDAGETAVQSVFTSTNGAYFFSGVAPGRYVLREIDSPGYISTGDTQGTNDNQIAVNLGNGVTTNGNNFFDFYFGLGNTNSPPVAVPDFTNTLQNVPVVILPLLNDNSPGGFALTITNAAATNGTVSIIGGTNILFTPANYFVGTATIGYTVTNVNGASTSLITITVAPVADLRIAKTGPASVLAVSNLTYTISVTNFGPSSASSVTVTDTLPNNVTFVSATGGGTNNNGLVTWNLGTLNSNQTSSVTVTVTAPASGTLTNSASVGAPTADTNGLNNVTPPVITSVTPLADLLITKTGPASVNALSNFSYTISVTNLGPSSASSVTVTDALPNGVTFSNATASGTNLGGNIVWNLGTLAALQATNFTLTVIAPANSITLTNLARVSSPTGDTNVLNNTNPPVITTVSPLVDVSITKTGPAGIIFGTNYNYQITVSNAGPSLATSLIVTDSLPVGLAFVTSTPLTTTNASNQVVWNIGSLAANTASNLTLTVISTQRGSLTNFASGGSPTPDPTPTNNVTPPVVTLVTNFPPLANPDSYAMTENTSSTLAPLVNDVVRTPGGSLIIVSFSATNGVANLIGGTNFSFSPTANFTGTATIGYTITDNVGGTNSSLITISVTNIPPLANPDSGSMAQNTTNTFSPLGNDSVQTPGGTLIVTGATTTNGFVSFTATTVAFTPANNFIGTVLLNYTISDGIGGTAGSTITVSVTNRPPVAVNDSGSTPKNVAVTIPALANDSDPDGNPISLVGVSPTNGTANIVGTNVVFTPTNNFLGTTFIGYRISDGFGGTNSALISILVTNRAPVAVNDSGSTPKNVSVTIPVLVNDSDPDGDAVTIISVSPTNGLAVISGTNVVFTPTNNFLGTAFIGYTISDGSGGTAFALIAITVTNRPPVAGNDSASAPENVAVAIPVLVNDSDSDGDTLTIISVSPTNGTASINGTNVIFTPATNFLGAATVGYGITDGFGGTNFAVIIISVTNRPPVANPDSYAMTENTTNTLSVLVNDIVVTPGGTLTISSVTPTNGAASISGTNIIFTPTLNFLGTATIGYTITDGIGGTNSSVATVTVTNIPPLANPDTYFVAENAATNGLSPLLNDLVQTPGGTLSLVSVTTTNGHVAVSGNQVLFAPTTNFLGATTLIYTITDGIGGTSSTNITINVVNVPPLALPDTYSVAENTTNTLTPLLNDIVRTIGGVLGIVSISPTNGTATIIGGTNVLFTPANNFIGTATIGYTIIDNIGGTNNSVITVNVTNVPPLANPDTYTMTENTTNTLPVLVNDLVITPGGTLAIVSVTPTNGTASISGTNIVFTPPLNFLGTATIGYAITDGIGGTNSTVVTVTVTNIPPVANPDGYTIFQNSTNTLSPLTNDIVRTPGGTLSIVSVSLTNGTASISGTNIIFTPTPGFTGTATIGYTITDGIGGTNSTVITVNVQALADIAVTKTGAPSVYAATNFDYTINVTNFGPGLAANLSVTDNLPATATFVSSTAGATLTGSQLVWTNLGSLAANAATTLTVTVTAPLTLQTLTNLASAGSPTSDPNPTNNTSPPVFTSVTPIANLVIAKTAPASVIATSNLTYSIFVTNFGPSFASSVVVTDTLPATVFFVSATAGGVNSSGLVTWSLGTLAANQATNFTVLVTAPTSGTLTNVANVSSPTLDTNILNNTTPPVITTVTPQSDLQIGKTGAASVLAVSNLTYTISVTNFGPSSASSVTVTDALPSGVTFVNASGNGANNSGIVTWSIAMLNSNQVTNVTVTVTAPTSGSLTNVASVGPPVNDPNPTNNTTPPVITTVTPQFDLAIVKSGPATVNAATNFTYNISVTNLGPSSASSIIVTDTLPANITFVSASGNGATNNGIVTWNISTLSNNQVTNLTVTVIAPASGSVTNVASVGPPTNDPNPTNNTTPPVTTTVTPLADVSLVKTAPATVTPGTNFIYNLVVTNSGPSSSQNLSVTDSLPANVTLVSATTGFIVNGGQLIWTNLGALAANAATNLSLTVTAPLRGSVTNTASAGSPTGDPVPTNNVTPPVTTTVLNLAPVAQDDFAGTPVNVAVTVFPLGNDFDTNGDALFVTAASATNGAASFTPTNVLFTPTANFLGTATVGYTISDGNGGTASAIIFISVTNRPPVANNDSASGTNGLAQTILPLVNDTDPDSDALTITSATTTNGIVSVGGSGTNLVFTPTNGSTTINYTISDGRGGSSSAVITVNVSSVADLGIGKTAAASVLAESNLTYTISVTNFGPSSASSVTVTDALPVGVSFVSASGNGATNGGNVIWSLGTLAAAQTTNLTLIVTAPASGSLTNFARTGSPTPDPVPTNNVTPPVITTVTPLADLVIAKTGPVSVSAASTFSYTISVTNFGPSSANSVTVTDTLPVGITFSNASAGGANLGGNVIWNLGTMTASQATNLTLTVIAPNNGTTMTNVANVSSPTGDTNVLNNTSPPVVTSVTPVADVSVLKTGPAGIIFGTNYNYQITVSNGGPSTATSLIVTDSLPVGLVFVTSTPLTTTNASNQVIWNLGNLSANTASNLQLTVISTLRGSLTNFASGGSPVPDPTPTNNVTPPVVTVVTNFPPLANPDSASMTENTTNTLSPLVNDIVRTPGGSLTIISITPTNGTTSISGTNVIFVPTLNFVGIATIGYTITDNVGGTNSSVITVTVTNIPPIANPDSYSMAQNTTNTFSPTANDTLRTLGGTLSLVSLNPTNGTASISGTNVIFTPTLNFLGTATIGYTITDGIGGTNSSLITINVTNRPPVANPDSYAMTENTTNTLPVLVNDLVITPDGTLAIVSVTPTNGTASINGTNIVFVPTLNFLGTATIGYTITDGIGGTNSSVATVTVTNIPPLANPDASSMAENTTNTLSPLANDVVRTPGGTLSIIGVSPTNGTANINGTNVTFVPTLNFVGVTTIGYTITDGIGGTNSSVITVTVTNQSPIAFPQTLSTTENVALPITLTGVDPVSRPLTFIIVSAPSGGTLTGLNTNTGAVIYTPTNNFTGTDSFVFRVNNGVNNSSNATITISVTPTADLLVQQSGPPSGVAGNNLVFTVAVTNLGPASATNVVVTNQIAAGYTFVSASGNGATNGNLVTWTIPVLPANGATNLTVTLLALEGGTFTNLASGSNTTLDLNATNNNGSLTNAQVITTVAASANLAITKTGPANVNATGSVIYNLSVTNSGPSTATGVIVTDSLPANVTFVSASGNGATNGNLVTWNLGTLANGATSNLTVTVIAPASGSLTNIASIGSPTPDPVPTNNVTPPVTTTVTTIADLAVGKSGAASSALGLNFTYTISVTNLGPSSAVNFAVTDSLPAGIVFVSSVPLVTTNASSQVIWTNLGTLALNATTNLTLTVKAVTRSAVTNFATVGGPTVDLTPTNNTSPPVVTSITNRPPLAVDDSGSTPKNVAITVPVLVNDSDLDGDALTIVSVSPTNGTANISGTNVIFTPANNFSGTAFIGYTITDGFGGTNSALITVNVTNRPPVANAQSTSTPFNTAKPLTLTGSDPDNDPLTFIIISSPGNGALSLLDTNTGAVTYTPANNFTGTDTFTFRVNDGAANSATATVSITVGTPVIADLAVFKTGPTNSTAGSNLVYSITVTNLGTFAATNVIVSDTLPAGFTFISATPPNSSLVSNVVSWAVFKLAANAKTNFTLTAVSLEGGTFTNFATATSDAYDPNPTNNNGTATNSQVRTVIAATADVQVFKDGGTNVAAGGTVNYVITATNAGPSTATNVVVKDQLPAGATLQTASGSYTFSNNVVTWSALTLTNGASVNYTIALTAPASGQFTNIALATSPTPDPNLTNNNGSLNKARVATKVVPSADLIVLLFGPTNAVQGSNFVYSLILSNAGPSVASNAITSDQLPTNFMFVSATSGGVFSNGIVHWPKIAFLNVGSTSNYFITVNSPFLGTFTNIASARSRTSPRPSPTRWIRTRRTTPASRPRHRR